MLDVGLRTAFDPQPSSLIPQPPAPRLRQLSVRHKAIKRSNSLYRDPPAAEDAPDEKKSFIGDGEPPGYRPQKACYPDLHNYLLVAWHN